MDDWRDKIKYQTKCSFCDTEIRFAENSICYDLIGMHLKCPACGNFINLDNNMKVI